ncbi:unnamed protein product [Closterium sp. NIES-54]
MASLRVLAFDHEGRPLQFDTWLDDLQLYLLSDSKDSVSLFDLASGAATAPLATADSSTRSQWLTRDDAARLAIRNHLPLAECAHFRQHKTALALYDAVVARYSSPATAARGRLLLPYLFPELSAFATAEDLVSHLCASDTRYRAAVPAEFLDWSPPPMYITLYFIVTRLPDSLRSVRDHFLSLDPTSLTVDLLEQHLLAAETSAVAVGAARGTQPPPFFEGCSPSPLSPSYASAAATDVSVPEDVGAASASTKRQTAKARVAGVVVVAAAVVEVAAGVVVGAAVEVVAAVGLLVGVGALVAVGEAAVGVAAVEAVGLVAMRLELGVWFRGWPASAAAASGRDPTCGRLHTQHRCFSRLDDAWRAEFGDDVELHRWADPLKSRIAIFDLDFDAILSAMYALSVSAEGDSYRCLPPDPYITATPLGASESGTLPGTAPAEAFPASEGAESGGAEPQGAASSGGSAGASPSRSPQQLREWFVRRTRLRSRASGAGGAGPAGAGGPGVAAGPSVTGRAATTGPGGARTWGTGAARTGVIEGTGAGDLPESGTTGASGAGAGGAEVGGPGAGGVGIGGPGVGGAGAGGAGAVDPGGVVRPRPYFVPLLQQVLRTPPSAALTPPLLCPPPDQTQPPLQPTSPLPAPSPYTEQTGGLTERREPASRPVLPVRTARRVPRSRPPPVPCTHAMTLRPSSVPLLSRLLATAVTDPSFESVAASALTAELLDFAAACRLDYTTALVVESASANPPSVEGEFSLSTDVLEDRQEEFESLAAAVPRFSSMLLAPEGDPDAQDIPTPRSYAEVIMGPYSSQWQAAMDAEMVL